MRRGTFVSESDSHVESVARKILMSYIDLFFLIRREWRTITEYSFHCYTNFSKKEHNFYHQHIFSNACTSEILLIIRRHEVIIMTVAELGSLFS